MIKGLLFCCVILGSQLVAVGNPTAILETSPLAKARVMGLSLGMSLKDAQAILVGWDGELGNPAGRENRSFEKFLPLDGEPYDAQLAPPKGTKYLGEDLKYLSLYFLPKGNEYQLYALSFGIGGSVERLRAILTKQFGPGDGIWSGDGRTLMQNGTEVLLFMDLDRVQAEVWFLKNRQRF